MTGILDELDKIITREMADTTRLDAEKLVEVPLCYLIAIHRDLTELTAALPENGTPCTAEIRHGPGHQSNTTCELTGPHDIHRAYFGGDHYLATWRGDTVSTGHFDEAPDADE